MYCAVLVFPVFFYFSDAKVEKQSLRHIVICDPLMPLRNEFCDIWKDVEEKLRKESEHEAWYLKIYNDQWVYENGWLRRKRNLYTGRALAWLWELKNMLLNISKLVH